MIPTQRNSAQQPPNQTRTLERVNHAIMVAEPRRTRPWSHPAAHSAVDTARDALDGTAVERSQVQAEMEKRILVVDDDEWVLFVLLHTLMALGSEYDVVTAKSGAEAWDKAQEQPFDLLITDLGMPAPDGVELTEMIRATSPETVVVWITAYGGPAIRPDCRRLDVYRCLEKPVEVAQIRRVARQALEHGGPNKPRAIAAAAS